MSSEGRRQAVEAMRAHGVDARAIRVFERFHRELEASATGLLPESTLAPLGAVESLEGLPERTADELSAALAATAVVKLNGGLGTGMGISGPKTALTVRDGLTFLDVIARQVLALRAEHGVALPVLFMDSFRTHDATLALLAHHDGLAVEGLPLDFLQSAEPKLDAATLAPVSWPADPELEWCPPGHGDVYVSLLASGLIAQLRARGIRFLFLSNADNLGATCDPAIPAWMAAEGVPYAAEVCERTVNDRKGGHLAVRVADGRLVLRDSAMVVPGEEHWFQDETRHRYFNTNNLWVDLEALAARLDEHDGDLGLPIIVNRKTVDPTDPASTPVIQVESAMGGAVELFEGARALLVPRTRFRPVKTTNELLLLRSDLYRLDEGFQIVSTIEHAEPFVDLSPAYRFVADFEARFPRGVPSIREARSFVVEGDVTFGAGVVARGDVRVVGAPEGPGTVADGTVLEGARATDGAAVDGAAADGTVLVGSVEGARVADGAAAEGGA